MKYLVIILSIICAASIISYIIIWPQQQEAMPEDTVATINGRPLTRQAILEYKGKSLHHGGDESYISEIITKQLLIAEAQRQGIDKEPDFRAALKTFYEHSLIKTLMERINKDIEVNVTDAEVAAYLASFGKTFTFYALTTSQTPSAQTIKDKGTRYSRLFDELGSSYQQALASLQPGQSAVIFVTGNDKEVVYLDKIEGQPGAPPAIDKDLIRRELRQAKVEAEVNSWIEKLRRQATITYHNPQE